MTWYERYLRSDWWLHRRREALFRAGQKCERCGWIEPPRSRLRLEVHHLTYVRLGREWPDDLVVLCPDCHATAHGLPPEPTPVAGSWYRVGDVLQNVVAGIERRHRLSLERSA